MIKSKKTLIQTVSRVFAAVAVVVFGVASTASASQITGRTLTLGNPVASASTTYGFTFTVPTTGTAIKSASFTVCTTASGTCTMPTGFANASSTLTGQPTNLGAASGWTVNTATTGSLRLVNSSNSTNPTGSQTVSFSNVTNPSATNSTFFVRIATFSGSDWTTGPLDTGTVAASTAGQVTVNASVDETLGFTIGAQTVGLGTLTTSTTGSGTSTMSASTNASTGYSITVTGNTLTGPTTLTAMSGGSSTQNSKQFGLNLALNSSPAVSGSAAPSGGSGTAATGYGTANSFKFNSTDTVASATAPTNTTSYVTSYIANIDGSTPAGSYSTVLTYNAIANF